MFAEAVVAHCDARETPWFLVLINIEKAFITVARQCVCSAHRVSDEALRVALEPLQLPDELKYIIAKMSSADISLLRQAGVPLVVANVVVALCAGAWFQVGVGKPPHTSDVAASYRGA